MRRLQLRPADGTRAEAEVGADRRRRDGVVAGDHPHVDARAQGDLDGVLGLGTQRVDDADHSREGQVLHECHGVRFHLRHVALVEHAGREGEDAQALLGEPLVGGLDPGSRLRDGHLRSAQR